MMTNAKFVDLSNFYNHVLDDDIHYKPGNDLKAVPHGVHEFAGVPFDVNGLIQLSGSISKEKTKHDYPPAVKDIPVNLRGEKVHFLQCASWHDQPEVKIGEYRLHYATGHTEIIPIIYQVNVFDWWVLPDDSPDVSGAEIAWKGDNERTRDLDYFIQFYKYTWNNPLPGVEITSIDFISDGQESAPFLMAITVE
jgi:hypothetical protein